MGDSKPSQGEVAKTILTSYPRNTTCPMSSDFPGGDNEEKDAAAMKRKLAMQFCCGNRQLCEYKRFCCCKYKLGTL
jgi:hypothetical protein